MKEEQSILSMLMRIMLCFTLFGVMSCNSSVHNSGSTEQECALQDAASLILSGLNPDEVNLEKLKMGELTHQPERIIDLLEIGDRLSREKIGYRTDSRTHPLTGQEINDPSEALSCTEFVWLVYSRSGVNLENFHIETKEMAYENGVYAPWLVKLKPLETIQPGDILVYEYPDETLIRQEEETGRYHSGHAVLVVSVQQKIVIGSHGFESTPRGALTGVGYRRILGSWQSWTAGRTLQAIYRFAHADCFHGNEELLRARSMEKRTKFSLW